MFIFSPVSVAISTKWLCVALSVFKMAERYSERITGQWTFYKRRRQEASCLRSDLVHWYTLHQCKNGGCARHFWPVSWPPFLTIEACPSNFRPRCPSYLIHATSGGGRQTNIPLTGAANLIMRQNLRRCFCPPCVQDVLGLFAKKAETDFENECFFLHPLSLGKSDCPLGPLSKETLVFFLGPGGSVFNALLPNPPSFLKGLMHFDYVRNVLED